MTAIALTYYSDQATEQAVTTRQKKLDSNEWLGKQRVAWFEYTAPAGAVAANSVIALTLLREKWRYLGGTIISDGFVATADLDVGLIAADGSGVIDDSGTADDIDLFGDAIDVATAGAYDLKDTEPSSIGYLLEKDCWVAGKLLTAGMAAADVLKGFITFAHD